MKNYTEFNDGYLGILFSVIAMYEIKVKRKEIKYGVFNF